MGRHVKETTKLLKRKQRISLRQKLDFSLFTSCGQVMTVNLWGVVMLRRGVALFSQRKLSLPHVRRRFLSQLALDHGHKAPLKLCTAHALHSALASVVWLTCYAQITESSFKGRALLCLWRGLLELRLPLNSLCSWEDDLELDQPDSTSWVLQLQTGVTTASRICVQLVFPLLPCMMPGKNRAQQVSAERNQVAIC